MPPSGRHDRQEDYDTEADVGAGRLNANIDIYLWKIIKQNDTI